MTARERIAWAYTMGGTRDWGETEGDRSSECTQRSRPEKAVSMRSQKEPKVQEDGLRVWRWRGKMVFRDDKQKASGK